MKKIAIYGTGRVAEYFMNNYDFKGEKLSLFIETKKSREEFLGYPVIDLKDATDDIDIIYFANTYADTVFAALEQGINPEKMVVVNKLLWETFIARNGEKNVKYISEFAEKYEKSRNKDGRARKVLMTTMNNPIDMNKMTYPEKCVVHKGFFPDTIPSEEINYAFVSLDCDLYEPILEGLRYFYPRLNNGGYLFIHDYNQTNYLRGVKQAVHDYENEIKQKLCKVPITDVCGTLVVCK